MTSLLEGILEDSEGGTKTEAGFDHAPAGWTRAVGIGTAKAEGLTLSDDHWEVVRALQAYYARHKDAAAINTRDLHDALEEKFHRRGGMRHLYQLFPAGPVAQGCRIAGLRAPAGAVDKGFGSVV